MPGHVGDFCEAHGAQKVLASWWGSCKMGRPLGGKPPKNHDAPPKWESYPALGNIDEPPHAWRPGCVKRCLPWLLGVKRLARWIPN